MKFGPDGRVTFLYYFASTAAILSLVISRGGGIGMETGFPQVIALVGGLIAGSLGAYFNRTVSFTVPMQNRQKSLADLEMVLSQMGYNQTEEAEGVKIYDRPSWSKWVSGKIYVHLENKTATIASRAATIRQLQQLVK
ncbi:MAG TPA: hypothetical protein V6C65_16885 [Allocoleopsis sp.]